MCTTITRVGREALHTFHQEVPQHTDVPFTYPHSLQGQEMIVLATELLEDPRVPYNPSPLRKYLVPCGGVRDANKRVICSESRQGDHT